METLSEKLNFSNTQDNDSAIEINKFSSVNFFDTLCLYCADNDIDIYDVDDNDFAGCADIMESHGQADKSTDFYFFWIDSE